MSSELGMLALTAQMGFDVVPVFMEHNEKGAGMLYMNADGLRFEPDNKTEPLVITWEEFNKEDL